MFEVMNIAHVKKAQPQYCSNLCMKVNAKLGGTTCKVVSPKAFFSRPTMIIGKTTTSHWESQTNFSKEPMFRTHHQAASNLPWLLLPCPLTPMPVDMLQLCKQMVTVLR
jgi:hypothetical protein